MGCVECLEIMKVWYLWAGYTIVAVSMLSILQFFKVTIHVHRQAATLGMALMVGFWMSLKSDESSIALVFV